MLAWPRGQLLLAQTIGAVVFAILFVAPLAIILTASLSRQWNGVLPTGLTFEHFGDVWGIRDEREEPAHTSCVAFGVDRLTVALFAVHGVDLARWPSVTRQALAI